jgi:hypothetical protein
MRPDVIDKIIELTGDNKSLKFWEKAVRELGEDRVSAAVTDLKCTMRGQDIENPAKYLTKMLKAEMEKAEKPVRETNPYPESEEIFITTLKRADHIQDNGKNDMLSTFSGKTIPMPTFLSCDFFTLSTTKEKSDCVNYTLRTQDGKSSLKLHRGKIESGATEAHGIPTIQHYKVLSAIIVLWSMKAKGEGGAFDVVVSAQEIAKLLGWKTAAKLSGSNTKWLRAIVSELHMKPYAIEYEEGESKAKRCIAFWLLGDVKIYWEKAKRGEKTFFQINFSQTIADQLKKRNVVSRSQKILQIKSELGTMLWMWLEAQLRANRESCINLSNLIDALQLPPAKWHKYKSQRRNVFAKAVKDLQGRDLIEGEEIHIEIVEGKSDYMLKSRLKQVGIAVKQVGIAVKS